MSDKFVSKFTRYINLSDAIDASKLPLLYTDRNNCCGCGACYSACFTSHAMMDGAISMEPDEEGFLYPIIDAAKCVRCFKCISVCPMK